MYSETRVRDETGYRNKYFRRKIFEKVSCVKRCLISRSSSLARVETSGTEILPFPHLKKRLNSESYLTFCVQNQIWIDNRSIYADFKRR